MVGECVENTSSMVVEYRKSVSGIFFKCAECKKVFPEGSSIYVPVEQGNNLLVFKPAICEECYVERITKEGWIV